MNITKKLFYLFIVAGSAVSITKACLKSQIYSQDLQWSGASLLLRGINPFQEWLSGNINHEIILLQIPNYLHLLYFILLPLGSLDFNAAKVAWLAVNLTCTVLVLYLAAEELHFSKEKTMLTACLFLISTPFRNTLGNGQISIIVLLCFMLSLLSESKITKGISSSIAIIKYSFAPPLILSLLYDRYYLSVLFAAMTNLVAVIVFCYLFKIDFIDGLVLPLKVSTLGVRIGTADIMSIFELKFGRGNQINYVISIAFCLTVFYFFIKTTKRNRLLDLAFISLLSLASFKHLSYDFVFLLPLLLAAVNGLLSRPLVIYGIIFWFWFGLKIVNYFIPINSALHYYIPFNFVLLLTCLLSLWHDGLLKRNSPAVVI